MADFSITLTVDDAKIADFVSALRWHYGLKSIDPVVEYTQAELKTKFKESAQSALKDIFKRHKEYLRSQQAVDTDIDVT